MVDNIIYVLAPVTNNDIDVMYEWQSQPKTRRYALNSKIPSSHEHSAWVHNKIKSKKDFIFVIKDVSLKNAYGVFRMDYVISNEYVVSIYISQQYPGKGIAAAILKLVDVQYPSCRLHATVLPENFASQRLFTKAGYQQIAPDKFIREPL